MQMEVERRPYYSPQEIYDEVKEKVESSQSQGLAIDYLTFVPDGEPTLDINLGQRDRYAEIAGHQDSGNKQRLPDLG